MDLLLYFMFPELLKKIKILNNFKNIHKIINILQEIYQLRQNLLTKPRKTHELLPIFQNINQIHP